MRTELNDFYYIIRLTVKKRP